MQTQTSSSNGASAKLGVGHRVIFISNRPDGGLEKRLKEELGFSAIRWVVDSPRVRESTEEAMKKGSYTLLLLQNSFISHAATDLSSVARKQGLKALLVNGGRPGEVQRAMQEAGVKPATESQRGKRKQRPKQPFSGKELLLIEKLALEGIKDPKLAEILEREVGISRHQATIAKARIDYFGIMRGEKARQPSISLPDAYFDYVQARKLAGMEEEQTEPAAETAAGPTAETVTEPATEEKPASNVVSLPAPSNQPPPPAPRSKMNPSDKKGEVVGVTIERANGSTVLVESNRSIGEIVEFLTGD